MQGREEAGRQGWEGVSPSSLQTKVVSKNCPRSQGTYSHQHQIILKAFLEQQDRKKSTEGMYGSGWRDRCEPAICACSPER